MHYHAPSVFSSKVTLTFIPLYSIHQSQPPLKGACACSTADFQELKPSSLHLPTVGQLASSQGQLEMRI